MIKIREESKLEVWGPDYINIPAGRNPEDQDKIIIQIEAGTEGRYMVEVIDPESEYDMWGDPVLDCNGKPVMRPVLE